MSTFLDVIRVFPGPVLEALRPVSPPLPVPGIHRPDFSIERTKILALA